MVACCFSAIVFVCLHKNAQNLKNNMDSTVKRKTTIDVKGLIGRLKTMKESAYMERKQKEKAKYEKKKRRERERYHEKKERRQQEEETFLNNLPITDELLEQPTSSKNKLPVRTATSDILRLRKDQMDTAKKSKQQAIKEKTKKKKITTSTEEKRLKEREKKRKQREKLRQNKKKHEDYCRKERELYQEKKRLKKIKSITDMSLRDQKEQRKIWRIKQRKRREKLKEMKKIYDYIVSNSPPESRPDTPIYERETTPVQDLSNNENQARDFTQPSWEKTPLKSTEAVKSPELDLKEQKLLKKLNYMKNKLSRTSQKLKLEKMKAERYKKKLQRISFQTHHETNYKTPSPQTRVETILRQGDTERIKKQLLIGEVLQTQIKSSIQSCSNEFEKKMVSKIISGRVAKKYKVTKNLKGLISYHRFNKSLLQPNIMPLKKSRLLFQSEAVKKEIHTFFISDVVSVQAPGKKDCITVGKIKMQKRYLRDSLKNLHKRFKQERRNISFATFYKYKPFWVVKQAIGSRDTCLCVKHANFNYIFKKLQLLHQFRTTVKTIEDLGRNITCEAQTDACLSRLCHICSEKVTHLLNNESDSEQQVLYYKWETKIENRIDKKRNEIKVKVNTKVAIRSSLKDVRAAFENSLKTIIPHHYKANHQQNLIRLLRDAITEQEAIINIDFSENYLCKFNEEIQSVHFGGSRRQISLHTGVLYFKDNNQELQCVSFSGVSDDLLHNACSIWAYLKPIMAIITEKNIKVVHFVSDGPTSQYKNRRNFRLICYFASWFKINFVTWNFYEPGHGKSVADGIGGALKRVADQSITYGNSITSAESFIEAVKKNNSKIFLYKITTTDINEVTKLYTDVLDSSASVPNTMKIRQIIWSSENPITIKLKDRSYFKCGDITCDNFLLQPSEFKFETPMLSKATTANSINDKETEDSSEDDLPLSFFKSTISTETFTHRQESFLSINKNEVTTGNWLLVNFTPEFSKQGSKPLFYICQLLSAGQKFKGTFLRRKATRDHQGYIYGFPDVPDIFEFKYENIKGMLTDPEKYGRGLFKFNVNTDLL